MTGYNIPQKISVLGETWELIKNANDPSVGFPFERVNTVDFQCDEITRGLYRVMVTFNLLTVALKSLYDWFLLGLTTYPSIKGS